MSNFEEAIKKFSNQTAHLTTNRQMRNWIRIHPEETRVILRQFMELTLEALEIVKEQEAKEQTPK